MNSNQITKSLMEWLTDKKQLGCVDKFQGHGFYEMDVLGVSSALRMTEYEIKISLSDYRADFVKRYKHDNMQRLHNKIGLDKYNRPIKSVPNYFYYVCPKGLIPLEKIPAYAGLLYLAENEQNKNFYFKIIKNAPLLHNHAADEVILKHIIHKLSVKYFYKYIKGR